MKKTKELVPVQVDRFLTASDIKANVTLIQEVMKAVMQKGQHYGVIPGCGDKPTLLKPGAEKLMQTFRLAPDIIVEDMSTVDRAQFRVTVRLTHIPSGKFVGAGIGQCSSDEEKYAWRAAVCNEEFESTPENKRRIKWKKGWQNKPAYSIKQVRTNPADQANTVLKIGKKRGLIDVTLTATGASDIFTQDIEDMPQDRKENRETPQAGPPAQTSQPAQRAQPAATKPASNDVEVEPTTKHDLVGDRKIANWGIVKYKQTKDKNGATVYKALTDKGDVIYSYHMGQAHMLDVALTEKKKLDIAFIEEGKLIYIVNIY